MEGRGKGREGEKERGGLGFFKPSVIILYYGTGSNQPNMQG